MSPPWMPLYIADYLSKTRRLSAAEHGAYLLLIMDYWQNGGLPDDDSELARIVCMSEKEWRAAKAKLARFFGPGWRHSRIDEELAAAEAKYQRRANAGRRGGEAKANGKHSRGNASGNARPGPQASAVAGSWPGCTNSQLTVSGGDNPSDGSEASSLNGRAHSSVTAPRWDERDPFAETPP